jgi:hypothetical protein
VKRKKGGIAESVEALRKAALQFPDTEEGISCKGTSLERATVKARNKAFVFLGMDGARVKLRESLAEAGELAAEAPERFKVGANGWVAVTFRDDAPAPVQLLKKWIGESYRLIVSK